MSKYKPLLFALAGCSLLSACTLPPVHQVPAMQPVLRIGQAGYRAAEWNRLARFHHERGQLNLALGAYAQSLALDAQQLEARNAVAVIEAQQGRLDAASKALLALISDYPGEAQPHTNLGYVQFLMGDQDAARQTLQRAMALGGGNKAFENLQLVEASARIAAAATEGGGTPAAAPAASDDSALAAAPRTPAPAAPANPAAPSMPEPAQVASRMELVQLEPHIFELKPRQAAPAQATPVAPPPAAPAAPVKSAVARLEVANGNGITGMAKRFRTLLGQLGIPVERLSNDKPYRQLATTIQYSPGFEQQAASLQKALQGKALLTSRQLTSSDVRLVLGKDAPQSLAAASESAGLQLVATGSGEE